jgi:hypothetical protein
MRNIESYEALVSNTTYLCFHLSGDSVYQLRFLGVDSAGAAVGVGAAIKLSWGDVDNGTGDDAALLPDPTSWSQAGTAHYGYEWLFKGDVFFTARGGKYRLLKLLNKNGDNAVVNIRKVTGFMFGLEY